MVSGLAVLPIISAKNLDLKLRTVVNLKTTVNPLIINFPALQQALAQSMLIDNQDAANPCTVKINGQTNTITIAGGNFRIFNEAWIEQVDITGPSTNVQVTSQVSPLQQISVYGGGVTQ